MAGKLVLITIVIAVATGMLLASHAYNRDKVSLSSLLCWNFHQKRLLINNQTVHVAVASTVQDQRRGLAGCAVVPEGSGLYFPFTEEQPATAWMKGMLVPIDIVWIREGKIVAVKENVLPPKADQKDSDLVLYHSPGPVDAMLEVAAGQAQALSMTSGVSVIVP